MWLSKGSIEPEEPAALYMNVCNLFVGTLTVFLALGLSGCNDSSSSSDDESERSASTTVSDSATSCTALSGLEIPDSAFGLSTGGAYVAEATLVLADDGAGTPEYCLVTGAVTATQGTDPEIQFQVNLPTTWNMKVVQFGGGGFNGIVITGLGNVSNAPDSAATPLERGYATFGSDSGSSSPDGSFGVNDQALANYSGESVKRTHDAGIAIVDEYYNAATRQTYYIGGSKGGHEALVAAQRYPEDYDGVVAYYPATQNLAMTLAMQRMWKAAYQEPGGWLNDAELTMLKSKVLAACDGLDGLEDSIVSNVDVCHTTFSVDTLRCPDGTNAGNDCLSDVQINTLKTGATPLHFKFPFANGVASIGPHPLLVGSDMVGTLFDDDGVGFGTQYYFFFDGSFRYIYEQDETASSVDYDYRDRPQRALEISQLYDATDPNIDTFKEKGGKMLIVHGTTDMLVPSTATTDYVKRLSSRYGNELTDFVRYYVVPGFGHGGGEFSARWDSLSVLEAWSEDGHAPSNPVTTDAGSDRERPLCEYPAWPRYDGSGDVNSAASFTCAVF